MSACISGSLVVKGNVYIIGSQEASPDGRNFDPCDPANTLKYPAPNQKPSSVKNYIEPTGITWPITEDKLWQAAYQGDATTIHGNLICTGKIMSTELYWSHSSDNRQPSHGVFNEAENKVNRFTNTAPYPS